jgi:hypothetical protein
VLQVPQEEREQQEGSDDMAVTPVPAEGLTGSQRNLWRVWNSQSKDAVTWQLHRTGTPEQRRLMRDKLTKEQLLWLLTTSTVPPHAPKPKPKPPALSTEVMVPVFVMPGPDAAREELIAALALQTDYYVARLAALRNWVITYRQSRSSPRRFYADDMNNFFIAFGIPLWGGAAEKPAVIPRPEYDFAPAHYTDAGLRWELEHRQGVYEGKFAGIRDYVIRNKTWFSEARLNEGLALIGQPPYVIPQIADIRITAQWQVPDDAQLTPEQALAWVEEVTAAAQQLVAAAGQGSWWRQDGDRAPQIRVRQESQ